MALLRNANTGTILATRVQRATTFIDRLVGLLARAQVRPEEGLWIDGCRAIHTVGMRATLDVLFLDREGRIVAMHRAVAPFRLALACAKAATVVELGAGALDLNDLLLGDRLELA
jgi:uncharacterized membrane protein (UPF0127 family)